MNSNEILYSNEILFILIPNTSLGLHEIGNYWNRTDRELLLLQETLYEMECYDICTYMHVLFGNSAHPRIWNRPNRGIKVKRVDGRGQGSLLSRGTTPLLDLERWVCRCLQLSYQVSETTRILIRP